MPISKFPILTSQTKIWRGSIFGCFGWLFGCMPCLGQEQTCLRPCNVLDWTELDLTGTMVDLPDTMVDLPNTMVDLPNTMVDLPNTIGIPS